MPWSAASAWCRRRAAGTRPRGGRSSQRSKEEANDYRYFPEPDLPPLRPSEEWVAQLRAGLPELPAARRARYVDGLGLSAYDAGVLTADLALADYFDAVVAAGIAAKTAANWVTGEFSRLLNQHAAAGLRASAVALRPDGARRADQRGRGRQGLGRERQDGAGRGLRVRRVAEGGRRSARAAAGGGRGEHRRRGRGGAGRVPGPGRRLPGRQDRALRVPGRPGHEAHRRPRRCAPRQRGARRRLDS